MARAKPKPDVSNDGHVVAGYEARRMGLHYEIHCPHPSGPEAEAWLRGYTKADREIRGASSV